MHKARRTPLEQGLFCFMPRCPAIQDICLDDTLHLWRISSSLQLTSHELQSSFLQNLSNFFFFSILAKYNCDWQVFPLNDVKHISCNFCKSLQDELSENY